ncbi:hypothetical protein M0R45_029302 [Rubus argutus]|uniref:Uncharacterized protein n=1 Tax=Rubus argutus TaxID=59490 RepID=A0AAW1WA43_RUBAR
MLDFGGSGAWGILLFPCGWVLMLRETQGKQETFLPCSPINHTRLTSFTHIFTQVGNLKKLGTTMPNLEPQNGNSKWDVAPFAQTQHKSERPRHQENQKSRSSPKADGGGSAPVGDQIQRQDETNLIRNFDQLPPLLPI